MPVSHPTNLKELEQYIFQKQSIVIVKFSATWCGPCKMIAPLFHQLSDDPKYKSMIFLDIDVDVAKDIAENFNISAMPTFMAIKNNVKVSEFQGASKDKLRQMVDSLCK